MSGACACAWLLWISPFDPGLAAKVSSGDFVGSLTCAGCHQEQSRLWQQSHHAHAMAPATPETVLGDFADREITIHGVTSRFNQRNGEYFVTTDGPDGEIEEFRISHTFGVDPLQQYLVSFPDGRMQALGLAWDTRPGSEGGQRWFHLYPDEEIGHQDELHWTGPQQNWNYQCADCHSTNLVKGYDAKSDRFDTTWSEISVGCEACHGPGAGHVDWASANAKDTDEQAGAVSSPGDTQDHGLTILQRDRQGATWTFNDDSGIASRTIPRDGNNEIQVCATCHSRRGTLRSGAASQASFLDFHMPAFVTEPLYHTDGQIRDEVYVWGSFLQSRMHQSGVTCSDCHEPHSGKLRAGGDDICATCHLPERFASRDHHGHPEDSAGADCLGCHMPTQTYMVVDPRRDHSLRPPRPDQSLLYGTPNACNQCHDDQTLEWAASAFERMYPGAGEPFQHWTAAFRQAREDKPQAEVSLIRVIENDETPDIIRATALLELADQLGPLSRSVVTQSLHDPSGLVRVAALRTLEALPPERRFSLGRHLLDDPLLAVRIEAGRVLGVAPGEGLSDADRQGVRRALMEYFESQEFNADRPESRVNLGNLQSQAGSGPAAESYYLKAIELDPNFTPAYLNLADLYRGMQRETDALETLATGLEHQPRDAALRHAMGLALVRTNQLSEALAELGQAVALDPGTVRYAYVLGIALHSIGDTDQAIQVLETAWKRRPYDRDLLYALSTIERDRGQFDIAREWAGKLLENNPLDRGAQQLLQSIDSAAAR